ncbi:winged helix DNA-binding domain-containing protein [Nocardioides rotundus]|uniref:winged helix DNA-binding domain-containing protein n=1 Tax=Nocardioides rotundus TaxID=1774216 RepID=UPI001CBD51FB|nr:winged helix DNA-binding domain-containing protein [Nocardioides rotundus]UAL28949.1 winged helix DNA-binding domain-containing protein [Nocardioides rotundus]
MRRVGDEERRHRLAARHALAPGHRAGDPLGAARAAVALHATEPATVYLSAQARVDGLRVADVDAALEADRSVVKQLGMRRTLFGFPRDLLPAVWGSAGARVAAQQERLVAKDVERHGVAEDGVAWLARAEAAVLQRLADGSAVSARRLREELPELAGRTREADGPGNAFAPRVLTVLGARGQVMRAENEGHWRTSRPRWALTSAWLGEQPPHRTEQEGYAELVRRWLERFGPGTEADLVWWLGATKGAVRRALADVGAVQVGLGSGVGWVLPEDEGPAPPVEPWAALLPVLDPATMGWRERDFYLRPAHTPYLFDTNGNGGTTAWWEGRIVGAWVQEAGEVRVLLLEDVGSDGRAALEAEAERLAAFLGEVVVSSIYKSALMKGAPLP